MRGPLGGYYPRFMDHREDARPPSGRGAARKSAHSRQGLPRPVQRRLRDADPADTRPGRQMNLRARRRAGDGGQRLAGRRVARQGAAPARVDGHRRSRTRRRPSPRSSARAHDKRFVQVQFSGRPHEPMGRRKYWPIYEACAKHGLHIMSHAFGSYGNPITGTGWPSFYLEDHVGPAQAMQANVDLAGRRGRVRALPDAASSSRSRTASAGCRR